jgi:hypothetical protein
MAAAPVIVLNSDDSGCPGIWQHAADKGRTLAFFVQQWIFNRRSSVSNFEQQAMA